MQLLCFAGKLSFCLECVLYVIMQCFALIVIKNGKSAFVCNWFSLSLFCRVSRRSINRCPNERVSCAWNETCTFPLPSIQTVEHGFPNQPSALAYDPKLQLMTIGTKSGAIKVYPFQGGNMRTIWCVSVRCWCMSSVRLPFIKKKKTLIIFVKLCGKEALMNMEWCKTCLKKSLSLYCCSDM